MSDLNAVFERNRRKIIGLAAKMLGVSNAEDAYQDAVIKALEASAGLNFANDTHADGWFYSVGLNVCRDRIRSAGRRQVHEFSVSGMERGEELTVAKESPETAEYRVNAGDETVKLSQKDIQRMVNRLPEDQRDLLMKVYYENVSNRELGLELGITEEAARVRVCRAMNALRKIMKREVA